MRRPTIKDVAKVAGVTYATVSRAMSDKPYVAQETRQRVARAAEELGYRPSAAARAMVSRRTRAIGMVVPNLSDPNFGKMAAGAEREARARGYAVVVTTHDSAGAPGGLLAEHRVDGIVVVEPQRYRPPERGVPVMAVTADDVPMDDRTAARTLAEHLRSLGHSSAVLLGGPDDSPYARERFAGLRDLFPAARWVPGDWTAATGYGGLGAALERGGPTAVLAANDFVAIGAMHALRARGLRVPADLSVTGFDDVDLARHVFPSLTTIRQDLELKGERATALLFARLEGRPIPTPSSIAMELVVRDSSGPAPRSDT